MYVISVAASLVRVHPRTLRIYEDEGLLCPARTPTNIRLYSEEDIRRILWIRHLTQARGVNLAGIRILFELEERLGTRILETLFDEANADEAADTAARAAGTTDTPDTTADVGPTRRPQTVRPDPSSQDRPDRDGPSDRSGRVAAPQETR